MDFWILGDKSLRTCRKPARTTKININSDTSQKYYPTHENIIQWHFGRQNNIDGRYLAVIRFCIARVISIDEFVRNVALNTSKIDDCFLTFRKHSWGKLNRWHNSKRNWKWRHLARITYFVIHPHPHPFYNYITIWAIMLWRSGQSRKLI